MYNPVIGKWISRDPLGMTGDPEIAYTHEYVAERMRGRLGNVGDTVSTNLYAYVENNPTNLVDPFGLIALSCVEDNKCTGGCIAGKDAKVSSCNLTKLEKQEGSDFSCNFLSKEDVCKQLKKLIKGANQKFKGKPWVMNFCSKGCNCKKYTIPKSTQSVSLTDEIIDRTENVPGIGKVHCIFKVSGTLKLSSGALVLVACEPKPTT